MAVSAKARTIETVTDAQGRYGLEDLPAGTHFVTVSGNGFDNQTRRLVTLNPGQQLFSIDLLSKTLGTIKGMVHGEDGEPVVGAAAMA